MAVSCGVENDAVVVHPMRDAFHRDEEYRLHQDAEVIRANCCDCIRLPPNAGKPRAGELVPGHGLRNKGLLNSFRGFALLLPYGVGGMGAAIRMVTGPSLSSTIL